MFLTGSEGVKLFTISIDRKTGKVNWKVEGPRSGGTKPMGPNSPVSPSPVTDGSNVYIFFDNFGLISYDAAGKERWRYEMGPFNLPYGAGTISCSIRVHSAASDGSGYRLLSNRARSG